MTVNNEYEIIEFVHVEEYLIYTTISIRSQYYIYCKQNKNFIEKGI